MPCNKAVVLLFDYLEGRLPEAQRTALEAHLADCGCCRAHLHTYRSTVALLGSLDDDDLPEELRLRLRSFLERGTAN